jgi:hypothetical protein
MKAKLQSDSIHHLKLILRTISVIYDEYEQVNDGSETVSCVSALLSIYFKMFIYFYV